MKSLLIIRHAKSSWDTGVHSDFDRPLQERGKRDAPEMARRLLAKKIPIDCFVSSTALRARSTAELFMAAYGRKPEDMKLIPELYHAGTDTFEQVVAALPDPCSHVALFSHNPGITAFVNTLTGVQVDNMPTCGIFALHIHADSWSRFPEAKKEFWFFDYPKALAG